MVVVTGMTAEAIEDRLDEFEPSGRELAYAESSLLQGSIGATPTDILGLSISFTVGTRPVMVESFNPVLFCTAASTNILVIISDGGNVAMRQAGFFATSASDARIVIVKERIVTPGSYTRKVRAYRSSGTGVVSHGTGSSLTAAYIQAVEQ